MRQRTLSVLVRSAGILANHRDRAKRSAQQGRSGSIGRSEAVALPSSEKALILRRRKMGRRLSRWLRMSRGSLTSRRSRNTATNERFQSIFGGGALNRTEASVWPFAAHLHTLAGVRNDVHLMGAVWQPNTAWVKRRSSLRSRARKGIPNAREIAVTVRCAE